MIGNLVKITSAKKLLMKISETAFDSIEDRLFAECRKKNFPTDRLATFTMTDDDGKDNYFVMISLDKYDKQNMRKFELLLKKDVAVQYRFKSYDFIPDGEDEQRCGINLELISIRQVKPKIDPVVWLKDIATAEIDKIADKAAARAINQSSELNAEEQAIDEDVEKQVSQNIINARAAREIFKARKAAKRHEITHAILDQVEEAKMQQSENLPRLVMKKVAWEKEQKIQQLLQEKNEREYEEDLPLPLKLEGQLWNKISKKYEFPSIDSDSDSEIDEIADKAAARAINATELNAEELAIDEEVEKKVDVAVRRRRTQKKEACVTGKQACFPTALETQMKALEDAEE